MDLQRTIVVQFLKYKGNIELKIKTDKILKECCI